MGWTAYVDHLIGRRLGQKTIARYKRWVADADEWLTRQGTTLDEASATDIREWSEQRVKNSHSSRGQASAALRHYWDMTERPRPPVGAIIIPPAPDYECRAIEEAQARDVVKVSLGWWMEGTVTLSAMYLALRRFEIAKMEWARFTDDLTEYRVTGKYSKTKTLPVHPILVSELEDKRNGSPWVFPGRFPGRHIADATVGTWIEKVGWAAGIDHLEPHELRHTALATANDEMGDLRAVQTFARHSDPSTTAIYTRTKKKRLREVSDSLNYLGDAI